MSLRPPSAQRAWDAHYSGDPAFLQPPPRPDGEPTDEYKTAIDQYVARLTAAKETGDWKPLLIEGQQPTKFVMGQVDRNVWRSIMDRVVLPADNPRNIGQVALHALLFRLSVKDVVGFPAFHRLPDPHWDNWTMAPSDLVTTLDEIDPRIVGELGSDVFMRLRGVGPKP
jgi:hypothetical protein